MIEYIAFRKQYTDQLELDYFYEVYDLLTGDIFLRIFEKDYLSIATHNNLVKFNNLYEIDLDDLMFIELKKITNLSKQKEDEIEIYKTVLPNTIKLIETVKGCDGKPVNKITKQYLKSLERDETINKILEMPKKTATFTIDSIKDSDGWFDLGYTLGLSEEKIYKTFEYGEYAKIQIEVDEDLNIIGGKIIPCGK